MHIYYKYKIYLKNYEKKLNRIIECKSITTLGNLAACIMATFKTNGKKDFYFEVNNEIYECYECIKQSTITNIHHSVDIALSRLNSDNFVFVYDYNQKYEFIIEKISECGVSSWRKAPTVLSGVGYGIVEDNKNLLFDYLNDNILFDDFKQNLNDKRINGISDFSYENLEVKYYNDYNKYRRKRMEI